MKNKILLLLSVVLSAAVLSCGYNAGRTESQKADGMMNSADYTGIYRIKDAGICDLVITIKKKNNDFTYTINGAGVKSSGTISVEKDDGKVYLDFNGTLRNGDNTTVTGEYSDKTILIQNYGNAVNQYICFKKCDAKFLEFVKSE